MRGLVILSCASLCGFMSGCGSIGEPLYPALNIPTRVSDLSAIERGDHVDVTFTIPALTNEGLALKQIGKIDLRIGPNAGPGFQASQWAENAKQVDVAAPAAPGFLRAPIPVQQFIGKDEVVAVRVANIKGRFSEWSNPVPLTVQPPLTAPVNVTVEAVPQGVRMSWAAVPTAGQYRLYRKTAEQQTPAVLGLNDQPNYLDTNTEFGKTYQYYVEAVHDQAVSDVAGPFSITPKDIFPPAVPTGLTASAGVGAVELAWERNTEPDFKEYRVSRAEGDGAFVQIADGLDTPLYSDRAVEAGKRYRYQIVAVDQLGNASQPSSPVEATIP
jgi:hypothetical protein